MSLDASGTVGDTLTFSKWKGRNYVRNRVIPANPKSASQTGVRAMMSFLAATWHLLATGPKATYATAAAAKSISPFNQFVSEHLTRWQNFTAPSQASPATEASTGLTVTTQTLTGGVGHVTLSLTPSGATSIWGYLIFREAAAITVPSWANCVAVIAANAGNAVTHVDSPLAIGTYHYRTAVFNVDGKLGTVHADDAAVVT